MLPKFLSKYFSASPLGFRSFALTLPRIGGTIRINFSSVVFFSVVWVAPLWFSLAGMGG